MWIFSQSGFYSIVKMKDGDNTFFVRARKKQDLINLFQFLEEREVFSSHLADYKYRIIISQEELLVLTTSLTSEINYSNFKGRIAEIREQRHKLEYYHKVWAIMEELQYNH